MDNFDQSVKVQKFHTVCILQNQSKFCVTYKNEAVQVGPDDARASNVLPVAIRFRLNKTNQSRIIEVCISFIFSSNNINCGILMGDSDVGDLMTVTDLRCWWQNHYVGDFFRYVGDFQSIEAVTNILNRSPTSQACHQHIWSSTCSYYIIKLYNYYIIK